MCPQPCARASRRGFRAPGTRRRALLFPVRRSPLPLLVWPTQRRAAVRRPRARAAAPLPLPASAPGLACARPGTAWPPRPVAWGFALCGGRVLCEHTKAARQGVYAKGAHLFRRAPCVTLSVRPASPPPGGLARPVPPTPRRTSPPPPQGAGAFLCGAVTPSAPAGAGGPPCAPFCPAGSARYRRARRARPGRRPLRRVPTRFPRPGSHCRPASRGL